MHLSKGFEVSTNNSFSALYQDCKDKIEQIGIPF